MRVSWREYTIASPPIATKAKSIVQPVHDAYLQYD